MSNFTVTKREEYFNLSKQAKVDAMVNSFNVGTCSLIYLALRILQLKVGPEASEGFRQTVFGIIKPVAAIGGVGSIVGLAKALSQKSHYEKMIDFIDEEIPDFSRGEGR